MDCNLGKKKKRSGNRGVDYAKWLREDNARIENARKAASDARKRRLADIDAAYAAAFPDLVKRKECNVVCRTKDGFQDVIRRFY